MLTLEEHLVNHPCPRIFNILHLPIFNHKISAATIRKCLEYGLSAVFSLVMKIGMNSSYFFLSPTLYQSGVQLHEANSDFQDCLTLPTLYYVNHDHIGFHLLVSLCNQLAKLHCAHVKCQYLW